MTETVTYSCSRPTTGPKGVANRPGRRMDVLIFAKTDRFSAPLPIA